MREGADLPGVEPSPGTWDWSADANQRWVLLESINRGVNLVEAFSNSPPYWMTISGSVTGALDGSNNNLQGDMYDEFADYLTELVLHYRDHYGVTFDTLVPLNEPVAWWWEFGNNQEGCHFSRAGQNAILKMTGQQLVAKGLTATRLAGPDENSIDESIDSYNYYDSETQGYLYQINTHTYNGSERTQLRALAAGEGKKLYVSEFGTGSGGAVGSALDLAATIALDLNELAAEGWTYWQAIENSNYSNDWGLIRAPFSGPEMYDIRKQYYAYLQFSRHIRPGFVILDIDRTDTVAALAPDPGQLVIVAVNPGSSAQSVAYDLSAFSYTGDQAGVYRTSSTQDHAALANQPISDQSLSVSLPARSVTTYLINTTPAEDQQWYALLSSDEWSTSGAEMTETPLGSGVHRRIVDFGTAPSTPVYWRAQNITDSGLGYPIGPGVDAWLKHDSARTIELCFDDNAYGDGWLPDGHFLYQVPTYIGTTYTVVGDFQSEIGGSDWDALSTVTTMHDDGTAGDAVAGDGVYAFRTSIPVERRYYSAVLVDQDWSTRITGLSATGDVPDGDTAFETVQPDQTVTFNCDIGFNRVKVTPRLPDTTDFGICLSGPNALPTPAAPRSAQDCLNDCDMDSDGDVDLTDYAAFQTTLPGK